MLTASGPPTSAAGNNRTTGAQSQTYPSTASGVSPFNGKAGNAALTKNFQSGQANKASTSAQGTHLQQPMVIPNSAGFPPRSLHAYIPGLPQSSLPQKSNSSTSNAHRHQVHILLGVHGIVVDFHDTPTVQTRYKTKVEQQKAETERMQALAKVSVCICLYLSLQYMYIQCTQLYDVLYTYMCNT